MACFSFIEAVNEEKRKKHIEIPIVILEVCMIMLQSFDQS